MKTWGTLAMFLLLLLCKFNSGEKVRIDPVIFEKLSTQKTTNVIIHMREGKVAKIHQKFGKLRFATREDRLNTLYGMLKENADKSQQRILRYLERQRLTQPFTVTQLWINNCIVIKGMSREAIKHLAENFPEIKKIWNERKFPVLVPKDSVEIQMLDKTREKSSRSTGSLNWVYDHTNCEGAHDAGCWGSGIVVGSMDTGVLYTHVALVNKYRGYVDGVDFNHDYNWWDPNYGSPWPTDDHGHGTHTTATICGDYSFGCCTSAQWIAAKGCDSTSCTDSDLLSSGQFMLCPTRVDGTEADCSKAPHIVSCSWAGGNNDPWYDDVIMAWKAANIFSVFAIGNAGYSSLCGTSSSPGDRPLAFSVGATNMSDTLAEFSGCGPTYEGYTKPDCSAPGVDVCSAWYTDDYSYSCISGTSMSTPCVSALVCLIMSGRPDLSHEQIIQVIQTSSYMPYNVDYCVDSNAGGPQNNRFGYGRIDCAAAVNLALAI